MKWNFVKVWRLKFNVRSFVATSSRSDNATQAHRSCQGLLGLFSTGTQLQNPNLQTGPRFIRCSVAEKNAILRWVWWLRPPRELGLNRTLVWNTSSEHWGQIWLNLHGHCLSSCPLDRKNNLWISSNLFFPLPLVNLGFPPPTWQEIVQIYWQLYQF